jgi:dolichyl-phosphate beta-glucosyltransferase
MELQKIKKQTFNRPVSATVLSIPDLTVIIPAYNEGLRLPETLTALRQELDQWLLKNQVLVVDDGSYDGSWAVVNRFGAQFSCLRMPGNSGKGAAVRAGMLQATGKVIAFTDADLPFALNALRDGYLRIAKRRCEVVCGDRTVGAPFGQSVRSLPWLRRLSGFVFRQLVQWIARPCVADTQCGLKIFSRRAAREIFHAVKTTGFAFDVEVICQAERLGFMIETVPVQLVNTEGSTISLRKHAWPMFKELLAIRQRLRSSLRSEIGYKAQQHRAA